MTTTTSERAPAEPITAAELEAAFAGHRDVPLSIGRTLRLRALDLLEKQAMCQRVEQLERDEEGNLTNDRELIEHAIYVIGAMAINPDGGEMFPEDDQGRRPTAAVLQRLPLQDVNAIVDAAHELAGLTQKKT